MAQLIVKSSLAAWVLQKLANMLTYSQTLDNTVWASDTGYAVTVTAGQQDPDGGTTGFALTAVDADAVLYQSLLPEQVSGTYTVSCYIKRKTGTGKVYLTVDGVTWAEVAVTTSHVRVDVLQFSNATIMRPGIKIETLGDEVYCTQWQLELGGLSDYVTTTTESSLLTITQITDANYPEVTTRGVAFMDGFFFVLTPDGEIRQSAIEDAFTWPSLDFIKSQNDPSRGVYIDKIQSYIIAFKEWSIEFFYNAGNPTGSTLSPVSNATAQVGCASDSSVQRVSGGLVWMGQTQMGFGRSIYSMAGTEPKKISIAAVDKTLDLSDLSSVSSWSAQVGSHVMYGVTLWDLERTLVYDFSTGWWCEFSYLTEGTEQPITSVDAAGVVSSSGTIPDEGDIVHVYGTTGVDGWFAASKCGAGNFNVPVEGEASSSGNYKISSESAFPISSSVRSGGRQYMQNKDTGDIYEFRQDIDSDDVGAIAALVQTPKFKQERYSNKFQGVMYISADRNDSIVQVRWSDDDYRTWSKFRSINLNLMRPQLRRMGEFKQRAFQFLHLADTPLRLTEIDTE